MNDSYITKFITTGVGIYGMRRCPKCSRSIAYHSVVGPGTAILSCGHETAPEVTLADSCAERAASNDGVALSTLRHE